MSRLSATLFLAGALCLSYGCARMAAMPDPVQRDELFRLAEQPQIKVVYYPPGGLEAYRGSGRVGRIDPVTEGSLLRNRFALEDPALQVKERILPVLAFEFGFKNLAPVLYVRLADDINALKADLKEGAFIDFKTLAWAVGDLPPPFSYSGVFYAARARLVRLDLPKVIWEGRCTVQKKGPTLEQLESNPAVHFGEVLNEAADACAADLLAQLRGKTTGSLSPAQPAGDRPAAER